MDNAHQALQPPALEICESFQSLDQVQQKAVLTTAAAMLSGLDNIAALAAGNMVLASAGYPPAPVYVPESGHAGEGANT